MSVGKQYIRGGFALIIGLAGVLMVLWAWQLPPFKHTVETTDNAYVRGQVTVISPQVAGYVTKVNVNDYQTVKQGDLLFEIDSRSYQQKLDQALAALNSKKAAPANSEQSQRSAEATIQSRQAQISGAKAALEVAEANAKRVEALLPRGVTTQSSADTAHGTLLQAQASVEEAQAALAVAQQDLQSIIVNRDSLNADIANAEATVELARIDLQNTHIIAPRDGTLGEVGVRLGQYVTAGTQLVSVVPKIKWVMANFKGNSALRHEDWPAGHIHRRCAASRRAEGAHRSLRACCRFRIQRHQIRQRDRQLHQDHAAPFRSHRHQ